MKKVIQTIFVTLSFLVVFSFTTVNTSEATVTSNAQISNLNNLEITIVRTTENGKRYISIFLNETILIMKVEEL